MKKTFMLLAVLALLQSCRKEKDLVPDIYWGEITATKNGKAWTAFVRAAPNENTGNGFYIFADVFNEHGERRETLSFTKIPYAMQKNHVHPYDYAAHSDTFLTAASFFRLVGDGDAIADGYDVFEGGPENYITVTSYDKNTGEVHGEFQVTMVVDPLVRGNRAEPDFPDTLRFTGGRFHTIIKDLP